MMRVARVPLMAAALTGLGCATLQSVQEPAQFIREANPEVVYVTFRNHSKVTIAQPRVSGDSLYGTVQGGSRPVAAPLSHVARIEALQRDTQRTKWLIAGLSVLTAAGVFALTQSSGNSDYRHPCDTAGFSDCQTGDEDPSI
jgi:hypothetical protein